MTRRNVRIDRLVLRGTNVDPRHAERLRGLVRDELARLLADGRIGDAPGQVPAAVEPEYLASPVARQIAHRIKAEEYL